MKTKKEALKLLKEWGACSDAMGRLGHLRSVKAMMEAATLQDLEWVLYRIGGQALAEYDKVRNPALAEYDKVRNPALAEYDKVRNPALAEYDKVRNPALAEYDKVCGQAAGTIVLEFVTKESK